MMIFSWLLLVLYRRSVTPWADHWFHYKARAVLGTHHHSTSVFFGSIGMLWRPQLVLFWCSVFVFWIAEGWSYQWFIGIYLDAAAPSTFTFTFNLFVVLDRLLCNKQILFAKNCRTGPFSLKEARHLRRSRSLQEEADLSGWFQLFTKTNCHTRSSKMLSNSWFCSLQYKTFK